MNIKKYKKHILLFLLILICLGLIMYFNRKNIDLYLLPPSDKTNKIYGEDFINILKNYGNVINISYPIDVFDIDEFTGSISNSINNSNNKCILIGLSFASFMSYLIASKCNKNLIGLLLISYSCDGKLTDKANKLAEKLYKTNDINERQNILNKLIFKDNPRIPDNIQNNMKISELSQENQKNISISIGKWISKHPNGICKMYDIPVFIIYGQYDITYKPPNKEICNKYNCTEIKNAGHGILLSHHDKVLEWLNNSLNLLI